MQKPRQLPLDLGHGVGHSRDDLVVSQANAEAVALVDRWPDWPAPVVVLAGPFGAGKTHLGAIWREAAGALSVPASAIDAIAGDIGGHPVLIDDVDSARIDEPALFHLINAVRGAGSQLLLTARRFPSAWGVALPDLASRLKAAATVEIHEPDDLLLAGVLTKLFRTARSRSSRMSCTIWCAASSARWRRPCAWWSVSTGRHWSSRRASPARLQPR